MVARFGVGVVVILGCGGRAKVEEGRAELVVAVVSLWFTLLPEGGWVILVTKSKRCWE